MRNKPKDIYLTRREMAAVEVLERVTAGSEHGFRHNEYRIPYSVRNSDSSWGRSVYYYPQNGKTTKGMKFKEHFGNEELVKEYDELAETYDRIEYPLMRKHEEMAKKAYDILNERKIGFIFTRGVKKNFHLVSPEEEATIEAARLSKLQEEQEKLEAQRLEKIRSIQNEKD